MPSQGIMAQQEEENEDLEECFQVLQERTARMSLEEPGQGVITHEEGEQEQPQGGFQTLPEPLIRNILERLEWNEWLKNRLVCVSWNSILNQPDVSVSCNAASSCQMHGPCLLLTDLRVKNVFVKPPISKWISNGAENFSWHQLPLPRLRPAPYLRLISTTAGLLLLAYWQEEQKRYVYLQYDPVYRTTRQVPPLLPWLSLPESSSGAAASCSIYASSGAGSSEVKPSTKLIAIQTYIKHDIEYWRILKYVSSGNSWEVISEFRRETVDVRNTFELRVWFAHSGGKPSGMQFVSNVSVIGDRTFILMIPISHPTAYFYDYESEPYEEIALCEVLSTDLIRVDLPSFLTRNCHIQMFEHGRFLYVARSCKWPQEKVQLWKVVSPSGRRCSELVSTMPAELATDLLHKGYSVEESCVLSFHIEAEGDYACFSANYNPTCVIFFDLKKIKWKKFDLNFDHLGGFDGRKFISSLWQPRLNR